MATCVICAKRASSETGYCRACLLDQYPPVKASKVSTPWLYSKRMKPTSKLSELLEARLLLVATFLAGATVTLLIIGLTVWMN